MYKKTLIAIFAVFAAVLIFKPGPQKALAYSTTDINNYFAPDSVYVDHLGGLQVDWHKVQVNWPIGYDMPLPSLVIPMINGTSTLPIPITGSGGPSGGQFLNVPPAIVGNVGQLSGGCAGGGSDNFSSASQNTYGNTYNYNQIWDGTAGTYVSVPTNVTSGTEIYFVYETVNTSGCGYGSATYWSSLQLKPAFVAVAAAASIINPVDGSTVGNVPYWSVNIVTNAIGTSSYTGTIEVDYGNTNSSSLPLVDSSTFDIAPNSQQTIIFPVSNNLLGIASSTWYARPQIDIGSSTLPGPGISFITDPNAPAATGGACDGGVGAGLITPVPSSTISNNVPSWIVATTGGQEGCSYQVLVGTSPQTGFYQGWTDRGSLTVTPTSNPSSTTITNSKNLWQYYNATTTRINYFVQVINSADGFTVGFTSGQYYLGYSSTSSPLTAPPGFDPTQQCGGICQGFGTVGGGGIATPSSTIAANGATCTPASGPTDIGGGIAYGFCTAVNYLFVANSSTQNIINGDMGILEGVPPFSWFFRTNAEIAALANGDTSYVTPGGSAVYTINPNTTTTPNNGVAFTILTGLGTATNTFTLLPANLTSNSFLSDGRLVDDYYNLILTFMIALAIIAVYKIIL